MKILMLISSLDVGGAETHLCELATELRRQGNDITVASEGGGMLRRLGGSGVKHLKIPLGSKNPIKMLTAYKKLLTLVRRERFDILHAHSRIAAFIGDAVARRASLPFITTVHAKFSLSPIKKHFSRWGYYTSAVSEDLAIYLRESYGISPDKIRIIPNGIDIQRFKPAEKTSEKKKNLLFVSRLDSDCSNSAYSPSSSSSPKSYSSRSELPLVWGLFLPLTLRK